VTSLKNFTPASPPRTEKKKGEAEGQGGGFFHSLHSNLHLEDRKRKRKRKKGGKYRQAPLQSQRSSEGESLEGERKREVNGSYPANIRMRRRNKKKKGSGTTLLRKPSHTYFLEKKRGKRSYTPQTLLTPHQKGGREKGGKGGEKVAI